MVSKPDTMINTLSASVQQVRTSSVNSRLRPSNTLSGMNLHDSQRHFLFCATQQAYTEQRRPSNSSVCSRRAPKPLATRRPTSRNSRQRTQIGEHNTQPRPHRSSATQLHTCSPRVRGGPFGFLLMKERFGRLASSCSAGTNTKCLRMIRDSSLF